MLGCHGQPLLSIQKEILIMSNDIKEKLVKLLREVKSDAVYGDDLQLQEDLDLDSLDAISFLFEVEKEFSIKVPEEDIDEYDLFRLGKLREYVEKKITLGNQD